MKVKINRLKCKRCGFEWNPRVEDVRLCPKCKSIYFDRERKKKKEKKAKL